MSKGSLLKQWRKNNETEPDNPNLSLKMAFFAANVWTPASENYKKPSRILIK